jgi:hypothetical protein
MSCDNIDTLLSQCGASLEVDENDRYYLKIRFFDTSLFPGCKDTVEGCYLDEFHHAVEPTKRRGDTYYRVRTDLSGEKPQKAVEQSCCKDLTNYAHCYAERHLPGGIPSEMTRFVAFKFRRTNISDHGLPPGVKLFADEVFEPQHYAIVTMKVKLDHNPTESCFFSVLQSQLATLKKYQERPVYTKFMMVLQCSKDYELYDELYGAFDPSRDSVPVAIRGVFRDKPALLHNRDYIWFVSSQIEEAQLLHNNGFDDVDLYERLKKLRPTGESYIDCCDEDF